MVVVHLEMPRTDVDTSALGVSIEREELLKNEEPILEVRIGHLQSQLDIHVVVLVVLDAEAVALEHLSVRHATVAEEDL